VIEDEAVVEWRADRSFDGQIGIKDRSVTSVLGRFGPLLFRSLKKGPKWLRTEVTKDRSGCNSHSGLPVNSSYSTQRASMDAGVKHLSVHICLVTIVYEILKKAVARTRELVRVSLPERTREV